MFCLPSHAALFTRVADLCPCNNAKCAPGCYIRPIACVPALLPASLLTCFVMSVFHTKTRPKLETCVETSLVETSVFLLSSVLTEFLTAVLLPPFCQLLATCRFLGVVLLLSTSAVTCILATAHGCLQQFTPCAGRAARSACATVNFLKHTQEAEHCLLGACAAVSSRVSSANFFTHFCLGHHFSGV